MQIKLEQQNGNAAFSLATPTTVSGAWETLVWDFGQLGSSAYDKLVFMFDINNVGNGSNTSTFYFDNVRQENTLSVNEFSINDILIYTNPIKNTIQVISKTKEISKIEVFNIIGKKLKVITNNFNEIGVEELSSGLYLIKVFSENKSFTTKIIKE